MKTFINSFTASAGLALAALTWPLPSTRAEIVFISSDTSGEIRVYDVAPGCAPVLKTNITHSSITKVEGLAVRPNGELFVVNHGIQPTCGGVGSVSRFLDPAGAPVFNGNFTSGFISPHEADFLGDQLLVEDTCNNRIQRFDFNGNQPSPLAPVSLGFVGQRGRGLKVGPDTNEVFVSICCQYSIIQRYRLDTNGNLMPNGIITGNGLSNPHGLTFSPSGELFVANAGNNSVSRFLLPPSGNAIANGTFNGNGLSVPIGAAFSSWDELFVVNNAAATVSCWLFSADGAAIPNGTFTTPSVNSVIAFYPFPNTSNQPPTLRLRQYAGLTICGTVGTSYRIEYTAALRPTNGWMTLTNLTLPSSPYVFIDYDSPNSRARFYRAVLQE